MLLIACAPKELRARMGPAVWGAASRVPGRMCVKEKPYRGSALQFWRRHDDVRHEYTTDALIRNEEC